MTTYKTENLIDKCWVCSDSFTNGLFPHLSASLPGHPCSLKHNYNEVRPVNNPTVISKCSSERKRCMSPALNKKLEMINLSEEGVLKAKIS